VLEKEEQGAENFLTRRSRRLTVMPPRDGWAMIIEQVRFLADGDLARHLSEGLGCKVVWSEVQGGALGWACFEFENGHLTGGRLDPASGREERLVAAANEAKALNLMEAEQSEMPVYPVDPEMDAWHHLCALGLPREYIFAYPNDIVRLGSGGETEAGFVVLKDSYYGGRLTAAVGPARFAARPQGLPYRPDLVAREDGQPTAIHEIRLLQGRPSRQSLDRAFEAELHWRRRAFYVMSETLPGSVPHISFRYKDPADPDRDLEKLLEQRREASDNPFLRMTSVTEVLALRGFAAKAAEVINAQSSGIEAVAEESGQLTFKLGEESLTLDAHRAYRRYLAEPAALESAAVDLLEEYRNRAELVAEATAADKDRLLPTLRRASTVASDAVSRPLGRHLAVVLAVERDGQALEVPAGALASLGLDAAQALEIAGKRLAEMAAQASPKAGAGSFGMIETQPPLPASSLLAWTELPGRLREALDGEAVIAIPADNVLIYGKLAAAENPDFRDAVARDFDTSPVPLTDALFRLGPDGPAVI
jgi:hypothetical protein